MSLGRPQRAVTVARVRAIEISLDWRWAPVLFLATWLLARNVLPARFPTWEETTFWLTALAAVLASEVALVLHEFGHAVVARRKGVRVSRIVFHGLHAVTHVDRDSGDGGETLIALAGPAVNVALTGVALALRAAIASSGALDAFLLMLALGNAAAAILSMVPLGASDGARALSGLRRRGFWR
jgi:Zn-dependent protease